MRCQDHCAHVSIEEQARALAESALAGMDIHVREEEVEEESGGGRGKKKEVAIER